MVDPDLLAIRKTRAKKVLKAMKTLYPDAKTELEYGSPFQLLVAVVMSAQATDKSVNVATEKLFQVFPDAFSMARASTEEVESHMMNVNLHHNKARNVVRLSQLLVERHNGEVPNDFDAILALPGAGRKTANVVLSNIYGMPAIAVDTHVGRLSRRLGLSEEMNPDKVEKDLMQVFPKKEWIFLHHSLILHGRRVCFARKPNCPGCLMKGFCPKIGVDEMASGQPQKD
ncbi:endonuclease III [Deinococcus misasensis]|uniref:endonuclease III n=1 Tax=Deinococcus misasensis TaxID=392413 RepID=UPI0005543B30|nr:endonuclease III [Deinococcus misasensis]